MKNTRDYLNNQAQLPKIFVFFIVELKTDYDNGQINKYTVERSKDKASFEFMHIS